MKRIRIVSEGSGQQTHLYDAESGEELAPVCSADVRIEAGDINRATIVYPMPKVDVVAEANEVRRCPFCGHETIEEAQTV